MTTPPDRRREPVHFWKALRVTGILGVAFLFAVALMYWRGKGMPDGSDPMLIALGLMGAMDLALILIAGRQIKKYCK